MSTFRIIRTDRQADASIVESESLLLGRASTSDLQLPHPAVAPIHAGIKNQDGIFWLSALADAATYPVLLNDTAIRQAPLGANDTLRIGPYLLRLVVTEQNLQISVDFALDLVLAEAEALESPISAGTPSEERLLERYWERRVETLDATLPRIQSRQPTRPDAALANQPRRFSRRGLAVVVGLLLLGISVMTWAFPTVYSPGPLLAAHASKTLPVASLIANQASDSCSACHTLTGTMPQQCSSCHTTQAFQATIAQKHLTLGLTCRTCHAEHRGAEFKPDFVANTVCTSCHQITLRSENPSNGPTLHGQPVSYPVRNGLWLWEGMSQTDWQERGLPGRTVDYNLREQFHLLHAQGPRQGRTQCTDCHLGGTEGAALKLQVRESCVQCHNLQPAFAATLARLAEIQPLKAGDARCVSCHAQHGPEKDLRASVRK